MKYLPHIQPCLDNYNWTNFFPQSIIKSINRMMASWAKETKDLYNSQNISNAGQILELTVSIGTCSLEKVAASTNQIWMSLSIAFFSLCSKFIRTVEVLRYPTCAESSIQQKIISSAIIQLYPHSVSIFCKLN